MKVSELASALRELGTVFKHGKKDEPTACIAQLLKLIEGKEALDVSELVNEARETNSQKRRQTATKKIRKKEFDIAYYLTALRNAATGGEYAAVKQELRRASPTNDDLRKLIQEYSGQSFKNANKSKLWEALESSHTAKQRSDSRGRIASSELPI
jgi:signal recognition particle GTPase